MMRLREKFVTSSCVRTLPAWHGKQGTPHPSTTSSTSCLIIKRFSRIAYSTKEEMLCDYAGDSGIAKKGVGVTPVMDDHNEG